MGLALPLEESRAKDQGDQIQRVPGKRVLNRVLLCGLVLELLASEGEMDPSLRVRTVEVHEPLED